MRADGIEEAAVICMAPQNSRTSVGLYRRAVEAEASGLRIDFTEGWAQHPLLPRPLPSASPGLKLSDRGWAHPVPVCSQRTAFQPAPSSPSRPAKANRASGPAARARTPTPRKPGTPPNWSPLVPEIPRWWFAFQSQGASGGPWIGPSVEETLESIAAEGIQGAHPPTHRLSLRSRRNPFRRGHPLSWFCRQTWRPAGTSGVFECFCYSCQGGCGPGTAGSGAPERIVAPTILPNSQSNPIRK
jgi:hypothetical protein